MNLRASVFSISLIAISAPHASGQKGIKGAYEGDLISPKNVMIIDEKRDSVLKGRVYINQLDHFPFFGYTKKNRIEGTILTPPNSGGVLTLTGEIKNDTIDVAVSAVNSSESIKSRLLKLSKSPNYNLEKYFGKIVVQYDPQLLGKWSYRGGFNAQGDTIKSKLADLKITDLTLEFFRNGYWDIYSPALATQGGLRGPISFRKTWYTVRNKLVMTLDIQVSSNLKEKMTAMGYTSLTERSESASKYEIKGDTLIKVSDKFIKEVYFRIKN